MNKFQGEAFNRYKRLQGFVEKKTDGAGDSFGSDSISG
jgi:hypothetical protein